MGRRVGQKNEKNKQKMPWSDDEDTERKSVRGRWVSASERTSERRESLDLKSLDLNAVA